MDFVGFVNGNQHLAAVVLASWGFSWYNPRF
jgi:hypothetical protein